MQKRLLSNFYFIFGIPVVLCSLIFCFSSFGIISTVLRCHSSAWFINVLVLFFQPNSCSVFFFFQFLLFYNIRQLIQFKYFLSKVAGVLCIYLSYSFLDEDFTIHQDSAIGFCNWLIISASWDYVIIIIYSDTNSLTIISKFALLAKSMELPMSY